ncbi:TusE/DsrC/DsvC family sulfur relay protein [Pistricoccus aurantiacus]|uniref:TusE/DsrC/DsvC family sulfur relay protein n=1 Tax=Pistricoccus aurantiacus TaxID=1883414 RepID=UPI003644C476
MASTQIYRYLDLSPISKKTEKVDDRVGLDPEGYLIDLDDWNPQVAKALARAEGRELHEEHWEIIDIVRGFYKRFETAPAMRPLVKTVTGTLGPEKGNSLYLMRLFPEKDVQESPARIVARLAGLPKPTNCL